jgi:hypothetical protein
LNVVDDEFRLKSHSDVFELAMLFVVTAARLAAAARPIAAKPNVDGNDDPSQSLIVSVVLLL